MQESEYLSKNAMIESIKSKSQDMFTEATMMNRLCKKYGYTQSALSKELCVSQSVVGNKIRLLNFSHSERQKILERELSERHARALLRIQPPKRAKLIDTVASMCLTVAQTEELVEKYRTEQINNAESYIEKTSAPAASVFDLLEKIKLYSDSLRHNGYNVAYIIESEETVHRISILVSEQNVSRET